MMSEDDLVRIARTPLPIAPTDSPWAEEQRKVRHATASPKITLPSQLSSKLAGVSFVHGYPNIFFVLMVALETGEVKDGDIRLHREPDNEYDPNAIAVMWLEDMLGHLPAALAERMAPEMDERPGSWRVASLKVLLDPLYPDRPGAIVELVRDDE